MMGVWYLLLAEAACINYITLLVSEVIEECSTDLLLTGPSAMFTSLDSDNDGFYDANLDCVWTIEATETQIVKLQIDSMDIKGGDDCSFDFLEVQCL